MNDARREPSPVDPSPGEAADTGSLLVAGTRGFAWTGGAQAAHQTLHTVIRLILANLLLPEDFGLIAMVMVFLSITTLLTDLGLGTALVQRTELTEEHRSTTFWSILAVSAGAACVLFLAAPAAGWFFQESRVVPILRVLSASLLLAAPEATYTALLHRQLDFRTLGLRRIAATLAAGAGAITAATKGAGVWALVLYALLQPLVSSLLLAWRASWRPRWGVSGAALRELWGFSRWITASRALNYFNRNADNLLIGRFLGAGALGLYSFSYQAVLLPLVYVVRPVATVSFPSFSKIQDDPARCARGYLRTLELVTLASWPLAALGVFASPAAVPLLVGDAWAGAVPIVQILSAVAALQAFGHLFPPVLEALGRARTSFLWISLVVACNVVAFAVGLLWGAVGVALALLVATALLVPPQWFLVGHFLPVRRGRLAILFVRGLGLWLSMGATWMATEPLLRPASGLAPLAASILLTLLAGLAASRLVLPGAWISLGQALRALGASSARLRGRP